MAERYCQQCNRKLWASEGDICNLCVKHDEATLQAHIDLYGEDDPGLFQTEETRDEQSNFGVDGVNGVWHPGDRGNEWQWYE
jgi:hypothetical protein